MKTRRLMTVLLSSVLAASALTGSVLAEESSKEYPEGTFMYCSAGLPQYKKVFFDSFLERNGVEGVNVEYQAADASTLQQQMLLGFNSGTYDDLPDVIYVGPAEIAQFQEYDMLMDLTDLLEPLGDKLVDGALESVTYNGKIYAFPDEIRPQVLYYNREIFEEYDIDPARCETIEGWIDVGRELKEKSNGTVYLSNYDPGKNTWRYYLRRGFIPQAGGRIFDEDGNVVFGEDEGTKLAMETLGTLMDEDLLISAPWMQPACFDAMRNNQIATFYIGAFYDEHMQKNVPDDAGKWGILSAPYFEDIGLRGAPVGGGAAIVKKPDQKYADMFYDIWMDYNFNFEARKEYVQQMMDEGGPYSNSVVKEALEDPFWQQGDDYYGGQSLMKAEADGLVGCAPPLATNVNDNLADGIISPEIEKFLAGEQTIDEALANADRQLKEKIE